MPTPSKMPVRGPSQLQMYYEAERGTADANDGFLFLVKEGMTKEELQRNINRRPALWGRFSSWLNVLPSQALTVELQAAK